VLSITVLSGRLGSTSKVLGPVGAVFGFWLQGSSKIWVEDLETGRVFAALSSLASYVGRSCMSPSSRPSRQNDEQPTRNEG